MIEFFAFLSLQVRRLCPVLPQFPHGIFNYTTDHNYAWIRSQFYLWANLSCLEAFKSFCTSYNRDIMSDDAPATTTTAAPPANVLVSAERLAELEAIEARYKIDQEKKKERLKALEQQQTPDSLKKRVMKHYELHKDEINAKRREKRRLEREAKMAAETPGVGLTESVKP